MNRWQLTSLAAVMAFISQQGLADATTVANPAPAAAQPTTTNTMSDAQKKQIQSLVHDYLVQNPEILMEVSDSLQQKQMAKAEAAALQTLPQIAQTMFFDTHSPVLGNPQGKVSIVEFFDYQCPHCKDMQQAINSVIKQNPEVKVVLKELPIFGATSNFASKAALAAQKQGKYNAFHEALFAQKGPFVDNKQILDIAKKAGLNVEKLQKDMNSPEVQAELKNSLKLASTLGLSGTPAFLIIPTPEATDSNKVDTSKATFLPGQVPADSITNAVKKAIS